MSLFKIPFETAEETGVNLEIDIPEKNLLKAFIPKEPGPLADLKAEVLKAVSSPVNGKPFSELIGKDKKVVFVTENQFRSAPAAEILLPLLKKAVAAGSKVSVVIACGKVPALSPEEIRARVGTEVVDMGIPVYCNDVSKPENYSFLGTTSAGTPLFVLKEVVEADSVITISTTQATLWGYGGSGMVIPGVSGNETIETNHVMALTPDCKPGNNDCKMQQDKYEALKIAGIDMGINVIVSNQFDVIFVNAGDPVDSHKAAVKFYDGIYVFDLSSLEKADIVITGSTAPTNHIFFHTNWGIVNCEPLTKEGATIIMTSPCPGYHSWPGFALMDLMAEFMPANDENNQKVLKAFFKRERELWAGCIWYPLYRTMITRKVKIVTREENIKDAAVAGLD
ncbi:MAG: lactate racemase domain-containing protein, partial [Eubacteriales bacterium]|nr:lactate racemase domain-containing protein [Eubacteriales bacterium]